MTLELPASNEPQAPPVQVGGVHWFSVAQFGLSMLAILAVWGLGLAAVMGVLTQRLSGLMEAGEALPVFLMAGSLVFTGILLVPSAYYSLMRAIGQPVEGTPRLRRWLRPTLLIFTLPALLALGYWVSQNSSFAWLLLPPIHVLAIGVPLLWLAYLGARDLPIGSPQRAWGVFASGLAIAPPLILFAELMALLAGLLVAATAISVNPAQVEIMMRLLERLQSEPPTQEAILQILQPILNSPLVIFSVIAFAAVVVPLIEEALKPIGLWLLAGRVLSPAAGFAAGLLSGTGYAVIESLLLTSGGQDWVFVAFARIATGAVHILTSGLVGWALVQAWNQGRYLRLGAVYLLAVLIHGSWNAMTLVTAFSSLAPAHGSAWNGGWLATVSTIAPFVLGFIAVVSFIFLITANRMLKRQAEPGKEAPVESVV